MQNSGNQARLHKRGEKKKAALESDEDIQGKEVKVPKDKLTRMGAKRQL